MKKKKTVKGRRVSDSRSLEEKIAVCVRVWRKGDVGGPVPKSLLDRRRKSFSGGR